MLKPNTHIICHTFYAELEKRRITAFYLFYSNVGYKVIEYKEWGAIIRKHKCDNYRLNTSWITSTLKYLEHRRTILKTNIFFISSTKCIRNL